MESYLFSLLPLLEQQGVHSHFIYGTGDPELWKNASAVPEIGKASLSADGKAEAGVRGVLDREKPDVVHIHNVQNLGVLKACLGYGRTVLTTHDYRGVCPANSFFYKRTQKICGRPGAGLPCFVHGVKDRCLTLRPHYATYFYRRSRQTTKRASELAQVIAPSDGARQFLLRSGIPDDVTTVLPYFCPVEPAPSPRKPPERTTITFLGRIASNKGHEYFIEALGLLPEEVQGVLVGNLGEQGGAYVKHLAQQYRCAARLRVQQWASRHEVVEILDQTTVFVFPSLWPETLGIVGIEAMARGVPVVASNVGGVTEWLNDGRNGRLVPPRSAVAIRDAVEEIAFDSEKLEQMGRQALETVRTRFDPLVHVQQLLSIYARASNG